jgi:hypothetical protein
LLDRSTSDLALDASGNIAVASAPYALAHDAASAIRLFAGELCGMILRNGFRISAKSSGQAPPIAGQVQVTDLSVRQPWSIPRGMNIQSPSFASLVTSPSRTMRHP